MKWGHSGSEVRHFRHYCKTRQRPFYCFDTDNHASSHLGNLSRSKTFPFETDLAVTQAEKMSTHLRGQMGQTRKITLRKLSTGN